MSVVDVEDAAWLSGVFGQQVVRCKLDEQDLAKLSDATSLRWMTVELADGERTSLVLKTAKSGDEKSILYGLAREGLFFAHWSEIRPSDDAALGQLGSFMPQVYHSTGDMATGYKMLLMEDLASCAQAGHFFGAGNPNNWGKDLGALQKGFQLSPTEATALCCSAAARLHAAHWGYEGLSGASPLPWLRGADWLAGQGQTSWEASQAEVSSMWAKIKEGIAGGSCAVKIDQLLVDLLDASIAKASWGAFQAELASRPRTLTHGDFHPANFLVRPKNEAGEHTVVLVDWEIVGVGSGPQDIGQFMISHTDPQLRASLERGAVESYHSELKSLNPAVTMTLDECWVEYVAGGLGRWLWFVPLLVTMCPPAAGQYFVDQVQAFAVAHGVTAETVPMPRA